MNIHEIHILMLFMDLKWLNALGENSNTSDFYFIKIILLIYTGSQDLYLGVYTDLIIGNWE